MATAPKQLSDPQAEKLRQIHTIPALVRYLDEELGWPIHVDDWEEAVFDWQPEELNLKAEHQIAIHSIKQLRPLVTGQPWGIFFVDFDKGQLPIVVLRRVLNGLAVKRRVTGGGHQTWLARDLLFISSFGEASAREIALAHFTDESEMGDLPTLRVLGWDEADTALELGYVARTLKEKLRWPARTTSKVDQDAWRTQWASAFSLKYRQVINDSKTLALGLAELAKRIRGRVNTVLALESENGHLRQLHKAFKDNLITDLSEDAFADMFAQTITYGLFTARASRSSGGLVADNLSDMVPSTNPFLKELLADFLSAAGRDRQKKKRVDFDELGINEVVTTLRDVPMDAVLRAFNAERPGDDPVIHFYEDFLKAYDKKMRAKRGVFYTPGPVVHFIVKSVDEILKTEFGIEDGLASTVTWGEMLAAKPELKLPKFCTLNTPFVQVLDPATGTGTFIVEVITQVHAHMLAKWSKLGKVTKTQWQPLWVDYVKQHLLPRLYAFELMMAPYAIAHMKIGLKLFDTGYTFPEDGPRVNVFLTNALEPAHELQPQLEVMAPLLAHEARSANHVKEQLMPTVVIGNPPYSRKSSNSGVFARSLVDSFKEGLEDEQNVQPLQDDYIKFVSFAKQLNERTQVGVCGLITNGRWLSGRIHRTMRKLILRSYDAVEIIDLHGSGRIPTADHSKAFERDENVFDIQQQVAISILCKSLSPRRLPTYTSLIGTRQRKYEWLLGGAGRHGSTLAPAEPYFLLRPIAEPETELWDNSIPVNLLFRFSNVGGKPGDDDLLVHFDLNSVIPAITERYAAFQAGIQPKKEAERKLATADKTLLALSKVVPYAYRPFDRRWTLYEPRVWTRAVGSLASQIDGSPILWTTKICADGTFSHVFVSRTLPDVIGLSSTSSTNVYAFPMSVKGTGEVPNSSNLRRELLFDDLNIDISASKAFNYSYAVLHSPFYREEFEGVLELDFPRIPAPGSVNVFDALAALGAQLVAWHLLEHPAATEIVTGGARPAGAVAWFGTDFSLQKVGEKGKSLADVSSDVGKVFINATSGFANVHSAVWQHTIGGYQVLHKWLDDRRKAGRSLNPDDITHWLRVYAALQATQMLMREVDEAIDAHGGWPGAFSQSHPPPDAATLAGEQMAQKAQLRAQKKSAKASKTIANSDQGTLGFGLFGPDSDLDELAAASGAPPRPKSRATPAKAAGGKASTSPAKADDITDWQAMCAIRAVLARAGASAPTRPDLIRATARELGVARTSPRMAKELDAAICRAVRRGVASNARGELSLVAKTIDGYDRDFLKQHLLSAITGPWCDKAEVPVRFARMLGFARTGPKIEETVWSLMRSLQRGGLAQAEGRGVAARYRKAKGSA